MATGNDIPLVSWAAFKSLLAIKSGSLQYVDRGTYYDVFFYEASYRYIVVIAKDGGADDTDFETNYKPTGNVTVADLHTIVDSGTIVVTQPTAGNLNANVSGTVASTQSGGWNITNVSGTVSLPTNAAQETGGHLASIDTKTPSLGQTTMAASIPIVVASNQSAVPVSGTVTANAGTGTFTVGQSTGTNLHTVVDSGEVSATVSQSAAGNLNATVVGSGNFTVVQPTASNLNTNVSGTVTATQATGTNLHTVVDSGTITATQATGTNLHTVVDSGTITAKLQDGGGTNLTSQVNGSQRALDVGIDVSGVQIDPRAIRALTSSDTVTVVQSTPTNLNATVQQPTGTNLHAVVDSGSIVVSQGTASNLQMTANAGTGNFTVVQATPGNLNANVSGTVTANAGTGNFTVVQPTGTSLHTVVDSGTITATATVSQATAANLNAQVVGNVAAGATDSGNGVKTSGVYNSTTPSLTNGNRGDIQVDSRSYMIHTPADGFKASYLASATSIAPAATATDVFTIYGSATYGSATKTIRVTKILLSGSQTTGGTVAIQLIKRSTTNTGGTSTTSTAVPNDSNDAAATATVLSYTTNPSALGTSIGTLKSLRTQVPNTTATSENSATFGYWELYKADTPAKAIVLRGASQGLCINFGGVTVTGGSFSYVVEWTEE